ncbi:MAG: hypothetical protein BKP49_10545 [Treponema sp. CETP13]|nr:MAG: hypothetical protein BKP49_10545 [Treponema sp. CETP13]
MEALILAAGFGKRLQPITNSIPKALVEVNGTPLLINTLNNLKAIGIKKAVIVVGHMRDKIVEKIGFNYNGIEITYVSNNIYDKTNNVYSMWLARDYLDDNLLMLECDLYYKKELLTEIAKSTADCSILTSDFNPKTMDGTVIAVDKALNAKQLILKKNQDSNFDYKNCKKTVNIYKLSKDFLLKKYLPAIDLYVKTQSVNSYYELVLGSLIYFENSTIKVINVPENLWNEIDNTDDLKRAESRFIK